MMAALLGTKQSNFDINVLFYPQYQDNQGQVLCYPGSVFEGVVQIKVAAPTPVQHIKLVFKASERVNYDAMGWEKSKSSDDRLFAVRTILWGLPSTNVDIPEDALPVLEAGEYSFPFICQMPVINFPPSFQHHLIATTFNLVVCIEKGNSSPPILSKLYPVQFQPIVETMPIKNLEAYKEETKIAGNIFAQVLVSRLGYSILEHDQSVSININFSSTNEEQQQFSLSQIRACIKRCYNISYKTFSRSETTIISQQDHPKLPSTCPSSITMKLKIPDDKQELPPTLTYSPRLTVEYKLFVFIKIRHGPIHLKKKIFEMPIVFGTLPAGTSAPRQLEPYSAIVDNTAILECKPHFIRPEPKSEDEEFLPAYDGEGIPPDYSSIKMNSIISY